MLASAKGEAAAAPAEAAGPSRADELEGAFAHVLDETLAFETKLRAQLAAAGDDADGWAAGAAGRGLCWHPAAICFPM